MVNIIKAFLPLLAPPPCGGTLLVTLQRSNGALQHSCDNFPELHRCTLDCSAEKLQCARQRCGAADVAALCVLLPLCAEVYHSSAAACGRLNNAAALQRGKAPPFFLNIKFKIEPL